MSSDVETTSSPSESAVTESPAWYSFENFSLETQEFLEGWLFVVPKLAIILFVIGFPMVFGIYVSMTQSDLYSLPGPFVGLQNYVWVLQNPTWWTALKNVFIFGAIVIPTNIFFSFTTALLLRERIRGHMFYRSVFLIPVAGPPIVWAIVWKIFLLPSRGGLVNAALLQLHVIDKYIPFLSSAALALPTVIFTQIWGFGLSMLIYMAALSGLPSSVMESAAMDGAGKFQKVRYIIWPLMKPTTFFLLVIQLTLVLRLGFGAVFVLTSGGPYGQTMVPSYMVYQLAFNYNAFGRSAAVAMLMVVATGIIALLLYKPLQSNAEYYQ